MKKLYHVFLSMALLIISSTCLLAQSVRWDKTFGGESGDIFQTSIPTKDGGYLLGGYSSSSASGDKSEDSKGRLDYWVVKIDASGNKQWDKTLGGDNQDVLFSIIEASDGGYLLGGSSTSSASGDKSENTKGNSDYWIVKIDASGNKQWDKTLGGKSIDHFRTITETADGGYLLGGTSISSVSGDKSEDSKGDYDFWLVKIDASGNKQWDRTLGGNGSDLFFSITETADGGYLLGGSSTSSVSGDKSEDSKGGFDYWVVKIDATGNKQWDKTLEGDGGDYLSTITEAADGGYLLSGYSWSSASGDKSEDSKGGSDYWVVKIDATGNKQWDRTLGGDNHENLYSTIQVADGGYLLGGRSPSSASGDKSEDSKSGSDYWVVKIDASGNKQWDKTIGGNSKENLLSISQAADGSYLLSGHSSSSASDDKSEDSKGDVDYWIVSVVAFPVLSNVPDDESVECHLIPKVATVTAEDDLDGTVAVEFTETKTNGACPNSYTLTRTWSATDAVGNTASASQTITVTDNTAPVISGIPEGIKVSAGAGTCEAIVNFPEITAYDNCGAAILTYSRTSGSSFPTGATEVVVTATDECGNIATANFSVTVTDDELPAITVPASITVTNDAGVCSAVVAFTAPTATDNCSDATIVQTDNSGLSPGSAFPVGTTTLSYTATDAAGNKTSESFDVTVTNNVPVISSVSAPADPVLIYDNIQFKARYTDNDLSYAVWNWGDGSQAEGIISEKEIYGDHIYTAPGLYKITLTITDLCDQSASVTYSDYVVVYDSDAGFITGGGWIDSPEGAVTDKPLATGKAHFGFVVRYQKKTGKPMGNISFNFDAGNIGFKSSEIDYLVLRNHVAHFKGSGNLKGVGDVSFFVSVVDGKILGVNTDNFRMKIWNNATGEVIYDNEPGVPLPSEAIQSIGKGSIVFHVEKRYDKTDQQLNFYPNPFTNAVRIKLDAVANEVVYFSIYDGNSNLLFETSRNLNSGTNEVVLNLGSLQIRTGDILIIKINRDSTGTSYVKLLKG